MARISLPRTHLVMTEEAGGKLTPLMTDTYSARDTTTPSGLWGRLKAKTKLKMEGLAQLWARISPCCPPVSGKAWRLCGMKLPQAGLMSYLGEPAAATLRVASSVGE